MIDFRPIFFVVGILLTTLALAMGLPAIADATIDHKDWQVFALSSITTFFIGIILILTTKGEKFDFELQQAFLLTTISWIILTAFAALPFVFSELNLSYTDAFFEAMSGITTTGSTIISSLENAPPGILLWRAVLQWLGGIGIIVMAVAILPFLQVGGMQLFRMESSDKSEKIMSSAGQIASAIALIYFLFTFICAISYWMAGMTGFDALAHAMTTIATGGYSTHDSSIGFFDSAAIDSIAIIFMILGSLPFVLYLKAINISPIHLFKDTQVRWFFMIVISAILFIWLWQIIVTDKEIDPLSALRYAAFNVTSIVTGTGYATAEYDTWGGYPLVLFLLLMFVGGCAGSTTCGIKIFRFQVLYATAAAQMKKLLQPRSVVIAYYNDKPIPKDVPSSVLSFFFIFILSFAMLALALSFVGVDFITAISGAATAIANVGPGLGPIIGPAGNFSSLSDPAKWILSAGMLLGRLELFTVLVLFVPAFWKK